MHVTQTIVYAGDISRQFCRYTHPGMCLYQDNILDDSIREITEKTEQGIILFVGVFTKNEDNRVGLAHIFSTDFSSKLSTIKPPSYNQEHDFSPFSHVKCL